MEIGPQISSRKLEELLENAVSELLQQQQPMSVEEACNFLFLTKPTIYSKVCRREIPFSKRGGKLYFFRDDLIEWIKEGANSPHRPQHRADQLLTRKMGGAR